jgi:hypothetical protein
MNTSLTKQHYLHLVSFTAIFAVLLGISVWMYVSYNENRQSAEAPLDQPLTEEEKRAMVESIQTSKTSRSESDRMSGGIQSAEVSDEERMRMIEGIQSN